MLHLRLTTALALVTLAACDEGPVIEARPQTVAFAAAPAPALNQAEATVSATASSGLPVRYSVLTADGCAVGEATGVVTATGTGTCTVAADQPGDTRYAPAPRVTQDVAFMFEDVLEFGAAPAMAVHDLATLTAVASTGDHVAYASATPAICAVEAGTGVVSALAAGDCTVTAAAGELHASRTFTVAAAPAPSAPGAPAILSASAGDGPGKAVVRIGAVHAGGRPITGYAVTSMPAGASGAGAGTPIAVTCPGSCAGYRFVATATNDQGTGPDSAAANLVTPYRVLAVFREPDTQPNDSIFIGTYTFDATDGVVSGLRGRLSESMTGGRTPYPDDTMTWLRLDHQLSVVPVTLDGAAGWLVTTFRHPTTDTLSSDPRLGGTDGWTPGTGTGLYSGYPGANPANAYARVFVNAADPSAAPTQAQLDHLAYADCAPGGMMGASCMTGTSLAGYGTIGTMGGYPESQTTERDDR